MCIFTKGNVFTLVCHSVHRGVSVQQGLCPGGLCLGGGSWSRRVSVQMVSVQGGLSLGGSMSRRSVSSGVCVQRWSLSRGSLSRGYLSRESLSRGCVCPWGCLSKGSLSRESLSGRPPPIWQHVGGLHDLHVCFWPFFKLERNVCIPLAHIQLPYSS